MFMPSNMFEWLFRRQSKFFWFQERIFNFFLPETFEISLKNIIVKINLVLTTRPLARFSKPIAQLTHHIIFLLNCIINILYISGHKMASVGFEPQ
jgi:hypothetical protein